MKRSFLVAVLGATAWLLGACTPVVINKSDRGIILDNPADMFFTIAVVARYQRRQALEVADEHCRHFGRMARLTRRAPNALYYTCVK